MMINIVKTHAVTSPESYKTWFDALKTLAKDLLTKSTQKWDWVSGDKEASAEIIRRLLLPFRPEWVNTQHLPQFQSLVNSLASKMPRKQIAWNSLRTFANKEIAEEIFKSGGNIQIKAGDTPTPDFSVISEITTEMEDDPIIVEEVNRKRKPVKEKEAKKIKQVKEPAPTPAVKPRKRSTTTRDEETSEGNKKKVSFGFEEPKTFVPEPTTEEYPAPPPRRQSDVPPNWQDFMPGSQTTPENTPKTGPKKTNVPKARTPRVKKVKKELVDVQAEDLLQCWDYQLNVDKIEPAMGLAQFAKPTVIKTSRSIELQTLKTEIVCLEEAFCSKVSFA
jgi:hypothetical protein